VGGTFNARRIRNGPQGLDLVLEAFSEMPDCHLTVCGPVNEEQDFQRLYYRELYETPNIHTVGWVDVADAAFHSIVERCIGVVYPWISERGGVSVMTCMHAGLIPIVSYESSVDTEKFGFVLKKCNIDEIKRTPREIINLPVRKLEERAKKAWLFARANHTRQRFAEEYKKFCLEILNGEIARTSSI